MNTISNLAEYIYLKMKYYTNYVALAIPNILPKSTSASIQAKACKAMFATWLLVGKTLELSEPINLYTFKFHLACHILVYSCNLFHRPMCHKPSTVKYNSFVTKPLYLFK